MLSWDCPQTPAGGAPPGLWEAPRKGVSRGNGGIKPQHPPERVCPVCASLRSGCSDRKFLLPGQPRHFLEGPTSFSQRPPSSGFTHNCPEVKALPEHTAPPGHSPSCPFAGPPAPRPEAERRQSQRGQEVRTQGRWAAPLCQRSLNFIWALIPRARVSPGLAIGPHGCFRHLNELKPDETRR